ncbi:DUF3006 domain-containing protein [Acidaminobacterium chupaoyuni]
MKPNDDFYILDRFEEAFAVFETPDGSMKLIPRGELPPETAEGDCFLLKNGRWIPQPQETARRKERIREKMEKLFHPHN